MRELLIPLLQKKISFTLKAINEPNQSKASYLEEAFKQLFSTSLFKKEGIEISHKVNSQMNPRTLSQWNVILDYLFFLLFEKSSLDKELLEFKEALQNLCLVIATHSTFVSLHTEAKDDMSLLNKTLNDFIKTTLLNLDSSRWGVLNVTNAQIDPTKEASPFDNLDKNQINRTNTLMASYVSQDCWEASRENKGPLSNGEVRSTFWKHDNFVQACPDYLLQIRVPSVEEVQYHARIKYGSNFNNDMLSIFLIEELLECYKNIFIRCQLLSLSILKMNLLSGHSACCDPEWREAARTAFWIAIEANSETISNSFLRKIIICEQKTPKEIIKSIYMASTN